MFDALSSPTAKNRATPLLIAYMVFCVVVGALVAANHLDWIALLFLPILLIGIFYLVHKRTYFPLLLVFSLGFEVIRLPELESLGTLSKVGGLILVAFYVLDKLRKREKVFFQFDTQLAFMLAYVFFLFLSYFWAIRPEAVIPAMSTYVLLIGLVVLVIDFVRDLNDINRFVWALIGLGILIAITSIYETQFNLDSAQLGRASLIGNANDIAAYMSAAIAGLVAMYGLNRFQTGRAKILWIIALTLLIAGIIATGSRGGVVSALAGVILALVFVYRTNLRQAFIILFVSLSIVFVLLQYFPDLFSILDERIVIGDVSEGAVSGNRWETWGYAWEVFLQNPVAGVGLDNFRFSPINLRGQVAHGLFPSVAAEGGIIGLFLFGSIIFITISRMLKLTWLPKAPTNQRFSEAGVLLLVMTLTLLVAFTFLSAQKDKIFWLVLALTQSLYLLSERQKLRDQGTRTN